MGKLMKYLKPCIKPILVIVVLLFIQAYCDLSLPTYTSDIVNVGIQQGGIDSDAPNVIRESEMEALFQFMTDEQKETITAAYVLEAPEADYETTENVYVRNTNEASVVEELEEIFKLPMIIRMYSTGMVDLIGASGTSEDVAQTEAAENTGTSDTTNAGNGMTDTAGEADAGTDVNDVTGTTGAGTSKTDAAGTVTDAGTMMTGAGSDPTAMVEMAKEKLSAIPDTMLSQYAIQYIKAEYTAIGIDLNSLQMNYIFTAGLKMLALALLAMLVSVVVAYLAARVGAAISRNMRKSVFGKVVSFSHSEFDHYSTASLITRSTNDIQQIQTTVVMMLRLLAYAPILAIGGFIKVFTTNTKMVWILLVGVGAIVTVVAVLFAVAMPKFKLLQTLVDRLNLVSRETITGIPVIRAFGTQDYEEKRFDQANVKLTKTNLFVNRTMAFMMPTMMLIMNVVTILVVWVGSGYIDNGTMQVGDMMAFIQYAMQIIMAFLMLTMMSIMLPRALVSVRRVDEVLTTEVSITDPSQSKQFPEDAKGYVEFKDVTFTYPGAEEPVLENITFTAKPGETTAIIGSTGSGKSTLVNLIPRFYEVTKGEIDIDGINIKEVSKHDLRSKLGFVPQKGVLFSGTIESNIKYGNTKLSEEQMIQAAKTAQAEDFIEQKEDRYESPIAQGGTNVSGGQKQRLSIARAIANQPDIYVFDDSFSALDYKTDVKLRKALKEQTAESTVIIVAQRISTILHAEQIIVLDEGKVAGIGTHAQLLKSCDVYREIAMSQLSKEELQNE